MVLFCFSDNVQPSQSPLQVDLVNGVTVDLTNGLADESTKTSVDLTGVITSTSVPDLFEGYEDVDYDPTIYDDYDPEQNEFDRLFGKVDPNEAPEDSLLAKLAGGGASASRGSSGSTSSTSSNSGSRLSTYNRGNNPRQNEVGVRPRSGSINNRQRNQQYSDRNQNVNQNRRGKEVNSNRNRNRNSNNNNNNNVNSPFDPAEYYLYDEDLGLDDSESGEVRDVNTAEKNKGSRFVSVPLKIEEVSSGGRDDTTVILAGSPPKEEEEDRRTTNRGFSRFGSRTSSNRNTSNRQQNITKKRKQDIPHEAFHAFLVEPPQARRNQNKNNNRIEEENVDNSEDNDGRNRKRGVDWSQKLRENNKLKEQVWRLHRLN